MSNLILQDNDLMTFDEVAALLRCGRKSLSGIVQRGDLPYLRLGLRGQGAFRFLRSDVRKLFETMTTMNGHGNGATHDGA